MNLADFPVIISERILPLDKDPGDDIYRVRRGKLPEFGDDDVDHREWYEGFPPRISPPASQGPR